MPYVQLLDNEINAYNPNGETMLYMTWGRKNGDASRCARLPVVCTYAGMDALTRERYMYLAQTYHAVVTPAGAVWRYIRAHYPDIELYETDESHPIAAGAYATACAFYTTIFRKDPTNITYKYNLSDNDAARIRSAAKAVVYDSLIYWHIGEYDIDDDQPPSVPGGLNATNLTSSGFTLRWNASTDNVVVAGYYVYLNGAQVATPSSTSANITGLNAGNTYTLTVKARDASGNISASSAALYVTTPDVEAPSVPGGLVAGNITETGFTLGWNASSDNVSVTGYDVYLGGSYLKSTASTSTTVTGLSASNTYAMTVRAKDAAGNASSPSTILNVTTPDTHAPSVPQNLASSHLMPSSFTLSWSVSTDNVGVTGYEVYRNGTYVTTVTDATIGITGLTAATTYEMTVKARDANDNVSAASNALNVTTPAEETPDNQAPSVPTGLSSGNITQTSLEV